MKNILIIGNANSIFVKDYIKHVIDFEEFHVDIIDIGDKREGIRESHLEYYKNNNIQIFNFRINIEGKFRKQRVIFSRIKNIIGLKKFRDYDIIHVHYITEEAIALPIFKPNSKIILTVYGSDVLRAKRYKQILLNKIFNYSDIITIATTNLRSFVLDHYKKSFANKIVMVDFGIESIELIKEVRKDYNKAQCKIAFGLPTDKISIFVGYNGSPAQRHIEIVEQLEMLPTQIKERICLVLHCGYSLSESYKDSIIKCLNESSFQSKLITDYYSGTDLIKLRMCCDILLNLQPTDALSSSMLECLACGSIVIKGDWLQYDELEERGVNIVSIPKINCLNEIISEIISDPEVYFTKNKKNYDVVYNMISWNIQGDKWRALLK